MANMLEGLKYLYSGVNWKQRQITLFSICGIAGLINGYLSLNAQGLIEIPLYQKAALAMLLIIFSLFLTGYEILFMHERRVPDSDMRAFKLGLNKIPFLVFIIGVPLLLISLFTKYQYPAFCIETFLAVPLTMLQAGFSYEYNNNDVLKLFKSFRIKEYFLLLIKRLWVIISSYIITFALVFIIFFIGGIIIALYFKGDINSLGLTLSSHQVILLKLSNYITSILLVYTLTTGTLVWDYELIKTYEREAYEYN